MSNASLAGTPDTTPLCADGYGALPILVDNFDGPDFPFELTWIQENLMGTNTWTDAATTLPLSPPGHIHGDDPDGNASLTFFFPNLVLDTANFPDNLFFKFDHTTIFEISQNGPYDGGAVFAFEFTDTETLVTEVIGAGGAFAPGSTPYTGVLLEETSNPLSGTEAFYDVYEYRRTIIDLTALGFAYPDSVVTFGFGIGSADLVWSEGWYIDDVSIYQCIPVPDTCNGYPVTVDMNQLESPTPGSDVILGTPGPDIIRALGGDDVVCAGPGADQVYGGPGTDVILGEEGADLLFGGSDTDTIAGGPGTDTVYGQGGSDGDLNNPQFTGLFGNYPGVNDDWSNFDTLIGASGNDVLTLNNEGIAKGGGNNDLLIGSPMNDLLEGNSGFDTLYGLAGMDTLLGGRAQDYLDGGPDADLLCGQGEKDTLLGDSGNDTLIGGNGNDDLDGGADFDTCNGQGGNNTEVSCELATSDGCIPPSPILYVGANVLSDAQQLTLERCDDTVEKCLGITLRLEHDMPDHVSLSHRNDRAVIRFEHSPASWVDPAVANGAELRAAK